MTVSSLIQRSILATLADDAPHSLVELRGRLASDGIHDYTEGQFSGSITTLIKNGSIIKVDRATYALKKRNGGTETMTCFVVSPIGEEGSPVRSTADKLLKYVISPVCSACGFEAIRVDKINDANAITQTVIEMLDSAELMIADLTGHNPNVFYEMGYRKCTNKPMILLKAKGENIPFDVNTIRTIDYDLQDLDNVEAVKQRLEQTIEGFSFSAPEGDRPEQCESAFSGVLPILYQIQDSISEVKTLVSKKDTETIQAIMQTSLNNAAMTQSTDSLLLRALLPDLLNAPQSQLRKRLLSEESLGENHLKK